MERLAKILARAGVASRRACETLIFDGRVTVDGERVTLPQTGVDPSKATILVDGSPVTLESKVYFLLNKPKGFECTARPDRRRVIDLFSNRPERLFTVGRLDVDTTGLLLVTNDGHLGHKVIHPSSNLQKEYIATLDHPPTSSQMGTLRQGARVQGVWVKPLKVVQIGRNQLSITVMEGRKREVRKIIARAGLKTLELSRIRIGNLRLENLPVGSYRELTRGDCDTIFH